MHHPFMEALAEALAEVGVSTLRFQFPYLTRGDRRPDPQPVLMAAVAEAVAVAAAREPELPLFAGGKSMGGRMTSLAEAEGMLEPRPFGIVFYGFPLHPAGKPGTDRAGHLERTTCPLLFLQGSRDRLADLALLQGEIGRLGPRATLRVLDEADHGFKVPLRTGLGPPQVMTLLADWTVQWVRSLLAGPADPGNTRHRT